MFFRLIKEYAALIIYFILAVAVLAIIIFKSDYYNFFVDKFGKGGFATLVTFFAAIPTIYLLDKRSRHTGKLVAKQQKQLSQDLLKNGIEHFASDKTAIRMGGIIELKRLINTDESVIDILMAFVRLTTSEDKYKEKNPIPSEDIGNILAIFTDEKYKKYLPTVYLNKAYLRGAYLNKAYLRGAILYKANLQEAYLMEAYLNKAYLREAELQGADLREAELKGADLRGAKLQGAILQEANLYRAILKGAILEGAILLEANLDGANLKGAELQRAYLQGANLKGAELQGAKLQGAKLQGAKLQVAELQGAKLQGAELQGAILEEANLEGAELQGANLQEAIFDKQTNFTGANLDGAIFSQQDKEKIEALGILDKAKNKDKIDWRLDYIKFAN